MISTSGVGDYQHAAEEFVGIERNRLSVFILHGPRKPTRACHSRPRWSIMEQATPLKRRIYPSDHFGLMTTLQAKNGPRP